MRGEASFDLDFWFFSSMEKNRKTDRLFQIILEYIDSPPQIGMPSLECITVKRDCIPYHNPQGCHPWNACRPRGIASRAAEGGCASNNATSTRLGRIMESCYNYKSPTEIGHGIHFSCCIYNLKNNKKYTLHVIWGALARSNGEGGKSFEGRSIV